jgi:hypothetical protein
MLRIYPEAFFCLPQDILHSDFNKTNKKKIIFCCTEKKQKKSKNKKKIIFCCTKKKQKQKQKC